MSLLANYITGPYRGGWGGFGGRGEQQHRRCVAGGHDKYLLPQTTRCACTQKRTWRCWGVPPFPFSLWASPSPLSPTSPTSCSAATCATGMRWSPYLSRKKRIPLLEMHCCSKTILEVRRWHNMWLWFVCRLQTQCRPCAHSAYISAADFFRQIQDLAHEFGNAPLFKIWLGTVPFIVVFHAETVEVSRLIWLGC